MSLTIRAYVARTDILIERQAAAVPSRDRRFQRRALENHRRKRQSKRAADGIRRPEAWSCRAELPCPFAGGRHSAILRRADRERSGVAAADASEQGSRA